MADVTLPQLGETVTEGTITQWFKQVGDSVAADEALFEVSTDKVDTEVPSPVAGTLTEIRVQEGETVDVGTVIAVVGDAGAAPAAEEAPAEEAPPAEEPAAEEPAAATEAPADTGPAPEPEPAAAEAAPTTTEPAPEDEAPAAPASSGAPAATKGMLLSPVVRRLVNEHGLDPTSINGSGPGGRITRDDVLDHIDKVGSAPAAAAAPAATVEPAPAPAAEPARRRSRRRRLRRPPPPRRRLLRPSRPEPATPRSSCRRSARSPARSW